MAASPGSASEVTLIAASQAQPELRPKVGYLLLSVDIEHTNATLNFTRLDWRKAGVPPKEVRNARSQKQYSASLKSLETGFYLLALPGGWYQINNIEAPYFNLPYRVVVDSKPAWRFQIQPQRVNYAGHLEVPRERDERSVGVVIRNRAATQLDDIQTQLAHLLTHYPLVHGGAGQDEFLSTLLENTP